MTLPFVRTDLHVDVGHTDIGPAERLDLTIDVTALLAPGQVPTLPTAVMRDRATWGDASPTTLRAVSITGNLITVSISGMIGGAQYRLEVAFAPSFGQIREVIWDLDCIK